MPQLLTLTMVSNPASDVTPLFAVEVYLPTIAFLNHPLQIILGSFGVVTAMIMLNYSANLVCRKKICIPP